MPDDDELDEDELAAEPEPYLRVRALRDGTFDVVYAGVPIHVEEIDIDETSLDRLRSQPRTVRS